MREGEETVSVLEEERAKRLEATIGEMYDLLRSLEKKVEELRSDLDQTARQYRGTCPQCKTVFDMLVHHYSIGLFNNIVHVKCPTCHKAMPVDGDGKGGIRLVTER